MKSFLNKIRAKTENNALPAITIVAFGDSVTQGVMEHRRLEPADTYHRQLQVELEAFFPTCTFNLINAGIAGDSATEAVGRLDRDVLRYDPDLVLVGFGLNDSIQGEAGEVGFCAAIDTMISRVRSEAQADVVVLTPPFMATKEGHLIHPSHQAVKSLIIQAQTGGDLAIYAQHLRNVAAHHCVSVADVHAEWARLSKQGLDTDLWLTNGLNHPNRQAHQIAKTLIWHQIINTHLMLSPC